MSKTPSCYALTMPVASGASIFEKETVAAAVVETLESLRTAGAFAVYAFAVLPDHLRVLVNPKAGDTLRQVLYTLRLRVAQALNSKGIRGAIWAPKSEIEKVWDPSAAQSKTAAIEHAPVAAGLAPEPGAYQFCSAHGDFEVDKLPAAATA